MCKKYICYSTDKQCEPAYDLVVDKNGTWYIINPDAVISTGFLGDVLKWRYSFMTHKQQVIVALGVAVKLMLMWCVAVYCWWQMTAMSQLVTCLTDIIQRSIMTTSQTAVICQLALIGLQLLCRLLGCHQPQLFTARDDNSVSCHYLSAWYFSYFHSVNVLFVICG